MLDLYCNQKHQLTQAKKIADRYVEFNAEKVLKWIKFCGLHLFLGHMVQISQNNFILKQIFAERKNAKS